MRDPPHKFFEFLDQKYAGGPAPKLCPVRWAYEAELALPLFYSVVLLDGLTWCIIYPQFLPVKNLA
jgi:hypothetical protein